MNNRALADNKKTITQSTSYIGSVLKFAAYGAMGGVVAGATAARASGQYSELSSPQQISILFQSITHGAFYGAIGGAIYGASTASNIAHSQPKEKQSTTAKDHKTHLPLASVQPAPAQPPVTQRLVHASENIRFDTLTESELSSQLRLAAAFDDLDEPDLTEVPLLRVTPARRFI
jgi:hypothetical protein